MRTRLSLSEEQVKQLNAIMDSTKARYHEVKERWDKQSKQAAQPELKAITEDQAGKIRAILSEAQQVEYEKYRAERQKRREQQRKSAAATTPAGN